MRTLALLAFAAIAWAQPAPVPVIFDTDMGPDSDDAGALAVLHALEERGEARVLATVCSTTSEWCAPAIQAINVYYKAAELPVGTLKGPGTPGGSKDWFCCSFNKRLATKSPNRLRDGRKAPDAVAVYRSALADQQDGSVAVICTGATTNLRNLLVSPPDAVSPLSGRELVLRKVRLLSIMGGTWPVGPPQDPNFYSDIEASRAVVSEWPTEIMFSGVELGKDVVTGARLSRETPKHNPVRIAYEYWDREFFPRWDKTYRPGPARSHSSYDQTSALYAVRGLGDYWTASEPGVAHVAPDGSTRFEPKPGGRHRYLIEKMPREQLAKVIEDLMVASPVR